MAITEREAAHVAGLARLSLSPAELAAVTEQLNRILEHVTRLQEVDTTGVPPTAHVLELRNALRPDQVGPGLSHAQALVNAPAKANGFFLVPRVVDEGGPA